LYCFGWFGHYEIDIANKTSKLIDGSKWTYTLVETKTDSNNTKVTQKQIRYKFLVLNDLIYAFAEDAYEIDPASGKYQINV
jgi:hypothetical protein